MASQPSSSLFSLAPRRRPLWEALKLVLPPAKIQEIITNRRAKIMLGDQEYDVRTGSHYHANGEPEAVMVTNATTNASEHTKDDVRGFYRRITVMSGRRCREKHYVPASEALEAIEIPAFLKPMLTAEEQGLVAKRGYCWDQLK